MNRHLTTCFASLMIILSTTGVFAQREDAPNQNPEQNYARDGNWAQVPGGAWNGSTSWITVDGKGMVYVLVRNKPYVRIFNRDGSFARAWNGPEEIGSAHSITMDENGNAWITDSARHVVRKYNADGELMMTLGTPDENGDNTSRNHFNQPNHVFIADNGDIYVSDGYRNHRVVHFSANGDFIRIIGGMAGTGPGEFDEVHGVALDSRGRILVNDSINGRVNVFDPEGNFIEEWPFPSRGGIEVRNNDIVYISDVNEGVINIVKDGELIDTAYAPRAHGLAVDSEGTIYTSGASRMTVFKLTPK